MRLLKTSTLQFEEFVDSGIPEYAILSHTWDRMEMSYQQFKTLSSDEKYTKAMMEYADKPHKLSEELPSWVETQDAFQGLLKIIRLCQLVGETGISHVWIDTCCINKESSAELSEAINSMYNWYKHAKVCWVRLADVSFIPSAEPDNESEPDRAGVEAEETSVETENISQSVPESAGSEKPSVTTSPSDDDELVVPTGQIDETIASNIALAEDEGVEHFGTHDLSKEFVKSFQASKWFTRGWTLQELLAPVEVRFFDQDWVYFGTKYELATEISETTGIDVNMLLAFNPADLLSEYTVAERMSWAAKRQTTRVEDIAYSLLGLFEVHMSLLYGEGDNAFLRLQKKILKLSYDETIFAWDPEQVGGDGSFHGLLAPHPNAFVNSRDVRPLDIEDDPVTITSRGASFLIHNHGFIRQNSSRILLPLNCKKDDEIVGISLARFRGVWYRVNKLMRHFNSLHELGNYSVDPVLNFESTVRESLYVSITATTTTSKDHLIGMQTTAPAVGIRFRTHMIPWLMFVQSVDGKTVRKLKELCPDITQYESKVDLLPVEMTDTGKEVVWAPPPPDETQFGNGGEEGELQWNWSPVMVMSLVDPERSRVKRPERRSTVKTAANPEWVPARTILGNNPSWAKPPIADPIERPGNPAPSNLSTIQELPGDGGQLKEKDRLTKLADRTSPLNSPPLPQSKSPALRTNRFSKPAESPPLAPKLSPPIKHGESPALKPSKGFFQRLTTKK